MKTLSSIFKEQFLLVISIIVAALLIFGAVTYTKNKSAQLAVPQPTALPNVPSKYVPFVRSTSKPTHTVLPEELVKEWNIPHSENKIQLFQKDKFTIEDGIQYDEFLKITYPNGVSKNIFHTNISMVEGSTKRIDEQSVSLSPGGHYLEYTVGYYEGSRTFLTDLQSLSNLLPDFIDPTSLAWADNDSFVVVVSNKSGYSRDKTEPGVYVMETKNPSVFTKIFSYNYNSITGVDSTHTENQTVRDVRALRAEGDKVYFTTEDSEKDTRYVYDTSTKVLLPLQ